MNKEKELIHEIIEKLSTPLRGKYAFVGLDGYVDKIQHPVQLQKEDQQVFYPSLTTFGDRIKSASKQSAQIELFTQEVKIGGNAPIMANALATLDIHTTCIGTLGYPQIDPVFNAIHPNCELISVGAVAETNALEFDDGKLILSELSTFDGLDWNFIRNQIDIERIHHSCDRAHLIALVDWCNLPHATDIWQGFLKHIVEERALKGKHFFFDLADPSKRSDEQVQAVLGLIQKFTSYGEVTLGINENEAHVLAEVLYRLGHLPNTDIPLKNKGAEIQQYLQVDRLLLHPVDRSYAFRREGDGLELSGKLIRHPKVSTGGGDNFNAGYYFGVLNGFSTEASMTLAMATSGAYVQNGISPDQTALIQYLKDWLSVI